MLNTITCGDCLFLLREVPDGTVDMILCDLPYGTTQNKWDSIIPLSELWEQYRRVIKPNGVICLTCQIPFSITLGSSNLKLLKYEWIWDKVNRKTGHLDAKKRPLKVIENVLVFYDKSPTYNPQMVPGKPYTAVSSGRKSSNYGSQTDRVKTVNEGLHYPTNLIHIPADERGTAGRIHPTQKPVALFEYLIQTYTNLGELVLDNCCGSGTTGVACNNTGRNFILMDINEEYCRIAARRLAA